MVTEGDPTDVVKVLHLLVMSFHGACRVCVVAQGLSAHVRLSSKQNLPVYFYCLLGSNTVSLAIYAVYHPRELLNWHETIQMALFFVSVIMAGLNAQWFTPAVIEHLQVMREIEQEHGLGGEIGMFSNKDRYVKLREQDPKYKGHRNSFNRYHGLSTLSNFISIACNTVNLIYLALHLASI